MYKKTFVLLALIVAVVIVGILGNKKRNAVSVPTQNMLTDVYPLFPGPVWGPEIPITLEELRGYGTTSIPSARLADIAAATAPFEAYYKTKLAALGWTEDISLDAGGPGSELSGYKKGNERIVVGYQSHFYGTQPDQPMTCPCDVSFSVFSGTPPAATALGYENTSYMIDGTTVTLTDGLSVMPTAPGSASMTTTKYFGNLATGDLNGDGTDDVAFLLTQDTGGSGTFYYIVSALKIGDAYTGTNAIFLGDRIAPQTTEIRGGKIIVNYADRKKGEPMTASPSLGVSKYLTVQNGILIPQDQ